MHQTIETTEVTIAPKDNLVLVLYKDRALGVIIAMNRFTSKTMVALGVGLLASSFYPMVGVVLGTIFSLYGLFRLSQSIPASAVMLAMALRPWDNKLEHILWTRPKQK